MSAARISAPQLGFNLVTSRYTGEVDVSPLLVNGLRVDVKLPLTLEKDRVALTNAILHTPKSQITITGAMEHLVSPRTNAHVVARVALDEVKQLASLGIPLDTVHGPADLNADVTASMDDAGLTIQNANVNLGQTSIQASGNTKQVQFQTTLALGELGRLFRVAARPEGVARLGGTASYTNANDYRVTANLDARNVAFHQGTTHIAGVSLSSSRHRERQPHRTNRPAFGRRSAGRSPALRRSRIWIAFSSPATCATSISTNWRAHFWPNPWATTASFPGRCRRRAA